MSRSIPEVVLRVEQQYKLINNDSTLSSLLICLTNMRKIWLGAFNTDVIILCAFLTLTYIHSGDIYIYIYIHLSIDYSRRPTNSSQNF